MLSSMARHLSHLLAPSLHPRSFLPSLLHLNLCSFFSLSLLTWRDVNAGTSPVHYSYTSMRKQLAASTNTGAWNYAATLCLVYLALSVHLIFGFIILSIQMSTYPSHQHLCPALIPPLVFWLRLWSLSRTARAAPSISLLSSSITPAAVCSHFCSS